MYIYLKELCDTYPYYDYLEDSPLPHTHPQRWDSGFMVKGLYS